MQLHSLLAGGPDGVSCHRRALACLPPEKKGAGWTPELVLIVLEKINILSLPGLELRIFRLETLPTTLNSRM